MTRLSKADLEDVLEIFFVANTPRSLLWGMTRTEAIAKLRKSPARELLEYYDRVTARAPRSELVMAVAYAFLCAILLRAQDGDAVPVDAGRLLWGEQIRNYFERSLIPTGIISANNVPPAIQFSGSASVPSKLSGGLFDADGHPVIGVGRNR